MAFDANLVILIGRLTRDPELSYTQNNIPICKFSIANNRGNNDEVNFFNIITWNKVASTCAQYLKKGTQVHITGKLRQDRWKDETGQNKSKVEVTGSLVQFLGSKQNKDNDNQNQNTQQYTGSQNNENLDENENFINDEVPF